MKLVLLAAAALLATPALAQTTGSTGTGTPVGPDAKAATATGQTSIDAQQTTPPAPAADPAMQTPATDPAMTSQTSMPPAPATGGTMTAGGYQPSTPMPMAQPGGPAPVFTPGPSVAQAYPAPAPLASYPICKKGQYDKCMQRGGK